MANTTPIVTTVTKAATKENAPNETETAPRINILEFCEEHYVDILPVMDRIRRDKRREVHTGLDFGENSRKSRRMREDSQNLSAKTSSTRYRNPSERPKIRDRLRSNDGNVFGQLGHRRESAFKRLSDTYSPSATESRPDREYSKDNSYSRGCPYKRNSSPSRDCPRSRGRSHVVEESYDNTYSSYRTRDKHRERHQRRRALEVKVKTSRKTRMPNNVKTYDGIGDLEDHVKFFQAATQVECWAMPTWCHMFNSTLIGAARVWFDELSSKSIDVYNDLKAAFLAYFMQQKKYVKDPVKIHNIKQRDGEAIEDFMERFKVETGRMKEAPEYHGGNDDCHHCLHMRRSCHRWQKQSHALWRTQDQSKRHTSEKRSDFRDQPKEWKGSNIFTSLTRTPKEILAAEVVQPPPPMKVTQSFERVREIMFLSLTNNNSTEGPLFMEAEIGGHMIHRMYVDGGSSTKVLYEHCFNWLRPEVKNQMG
nr:reverse transcriptase domain-containing protein [Tanacetum cinerariifolium]